MTWTIVWWGSSEMLTIDVSSDRTTTTLSLLSWHALFLLEIDRQKGIPGWCESDEYMGNVTTHSGRKSERFLISKMSQPSLLRRSLQVTVVVEFI